MSSQNGISDEVIASKAYDLVDLKNQLDCVLQLQPQVNDLLNYKPDGDTITDRAQDWLYQIQNTLNPIYNDYEMDESNDMGFRIVYDYFKPDCQIENNIDSEYINKLRVGTSYSNIQTNLQRIVKFLDTRLSQLQSAMNNNEGKSIGNIKMELTKKTKALMGIKGTPALNEQQMYQAEGDFDAIVEWLNKVVDGKLTAIGNINDLQKTIESMGDSYNIPELGRLFGSIRQAAMSLSDASDTTQEIINKYGIPMSR